jgi:putative iron-regulated protein
VSEGNPQAALSAIFTGMGSLSYGELAGERMRLGLMLNDPEEEHDCFSDNTHNSHYYDGLGISNAWHARYVRPDGSVVEGASLRDLVAAHDAGLARAIDAQIAASVVALAAIKTAAEGGMAYDMMLARGNAEGEALIMAAVGALVDQTRGFERAIAALGIEGVGIEGSDSLDNPDAVFQ